MSKRVTLTEDDIEVIEISLKMLVDKSDWSPKVYPEYGLLAKQRMKQLLSKLKSQDQRPVETLGLPGNGDKDIVTRGAK